MNDSALNRRGALAVLGLAVAGAAVARTASAAVANDQVPAGASGAAGDKGSAVAIPVGLAAGSYRVKAVSPLSYGGFYVQLENDAHDLCVVSVCARNKTPGAAQAPAHTDNLDLFLVNEGNGSVPTHEPHGLAAMALAQSLRSFDAQLGALPLLTRSERLSRHREVIFVPNFGLRHANSPGRAGVQQRLRLLRPGRSA